MTNQTTDEAAVDIVERLRNDCHSSSICIASRARDEIETLRAQLTDATRRAEQAERMLAEAWRPIETVKHEHGVPIIVCQDGNPEAVVEWLDADFVDDDGFISGWYISDGKNDPIWYRGNPYLTHWQPLFPPPSIRSAASGEQG